MLSKEQLLARLAEGHAAGITVVTPNTRLSQALVSEFDAFQLAGDRTAWEAADILPVGAFVERMYEDALYAPPGETGPSDLPLLLTRAQEQLLWAEAIRAAPRELLSVERTAAECADAWRLMHAWRIDLPRGRTAANEDVQAFQDWAAAYRRRTAGEVDAARLPDLVSRHLGSLRKPRLLVAYAFDLLPPQTKALFDALAAQGVEVAECKPGPKDSVVSRGAFSSAKEELEKAAAWARARLESGATRIGVVVPELELRRREVVRVFSRTLRPGYNLPGAGREPLPFNVSIGTPLAGYPLVALALSLLRFSRDDLPFPDVSRLVRSPFLGGAETELAFRTRLDVSLRRKVEATLGLPKLISLVERSILRERLEKVFAIARDDLLSPQTPSDWARHFSTLLEAAGFPGERGLDSEEFQARAKLNEMLGELSRLERVSARMNFGHALATLERLCRETLFQPQTPDAPIQVLGILESAGLEFDHLWVSGLTDEAWPLHARANPFIPVALQRKAGIPESSPEGSLALDRRITEGWRSAAREVVFSYYEKDEDRTLAPSPLLSFVAEKYLEQAAAGPRLRDRVFASRNLSSSEDRVAPPVAVLQVKGGTRVLSDQAACPFRAFARHRLAARPLEEPVEGLDAAQRGSLLHAFMKNLFTVVKSSDQLRADLAPAIAAAAAAAVKDLGLEGRFAELERERLARIGEEWLEVERARAPFEVAALEEKRVIQLARLQFEGRIDRMDRLEKGHALIDYKTSRAPTPKHWEPPRPEDPQLPLYAVSAKEDIAAVAFAKVRRGDMKLMGFSRLDNALPGVKKAKAWEPLLKSWKDEAEDLAASFKSGEARVDPKRHLQTCRYCDLHALCRVYEKVNVLEETEGEGEGAAA
jgi:ATP-dependent helicase/nuclease subunit B